MHPISALTQWLSRTWNSPQSVSALEAILKWVVAVAGIIILVLSWRVSCLRRRADTANLVKLAALEARDTTREKTVSDMAAQIEAQSHRAERDLEDFKNNINASVGRGY